MFPSFPSDGPSNSPPQFPMTALTLTFFSGMTSVLGGLIVVLFGIPTPRTLAHLLSFASGIMLYVSYADLLAHAVEGINSSVEASGSDSHEHHHGHDHGHHGHNHGHSHGTGHFEANVCMLLGMVFWGLLALFIPNADEVDGHGHSHGGVLTAPPVVAGVKPIPKSRSISRGRSSRSSVAASPRTNASPEKKSVGKKLELRNDPKNSLTVSRERRMLLTGLITALGITLHNLPEGLVVYNATLGGICDSHALPSDPGTFAAWFGLPRDLRSCFSSGVAVAFAIALHNIPEGMAVASPVLASTGSAWKAMGLTFAASSVEPLVGMIFGFFFNSYVTSKFVWQLNAGVAGIMIALCFGELMPASLASISPKVRLCVCLPSSPCHVFG